MKHGIVVDMYALEDDQILRPAQVHAQRELAKVAEAKFGFKYACDMHEKLLAGAPEGDVLLRQVMSS